jgi:hypothetical protein
VLAKRARPPSASRCVQLDQRFIEKGISHRTLEKRFGESVLRFTDQDGMALALVGIADAENEPGWSNEDIPAEHAIRGFQGVTLLLDSAQKTAAILTDVFGFRKVAREGAVIRFTAVGEMRGSVVDLYEAPGNPARPPRSRFSASHRLPWCRRPTAGPDDREADPLPWPAPDRTKGPQVFSLGLFP